MKPPRLFLLPLLVLLIPGGTAAKAEEEFSLGSHFTYRGHLDQKGAPASGRFDLSFELYDAREGGELLGRIDRFDQEVLDGELSAKLDFGPAAFEDGPPWLDIQVRPAGRGSFTRLSPRQLVSRGTVCTVNSDVEVNGELTVGQGHQLLVGGPLTGLRLADREISVSPLWLDRELILDADQVGIDVAQAEAPLSLPSGPDVTPTSGGSLIVGSTTASNIAIDANEIMARKNGAPATLNLNGEGGDVSIGGFLVAGYQIVEQGGCMDGTMIDAVCPAGTRVLGGSCSAMDDTLAMYPLEIGGVEGRGWHCTIRNCSGHSRAYAVCAAIR